MLHAKPCIELAIYHGASMKLAVVGLILVIVTVEAGAAAEQQFSCKGQVIQQMSNPAVPPKPIDLNVSLVDKNRMSIKTSDDKVLALAHHQQQHNTAQVRNEGLCWRIFSLHRRSFSYLQVGAARTVDLLSHLNLEHDGLPRPNTDSRVHHYD